MCLPSVLNAYNTYLLIRFNFRSPSHSAIEVVESGTVRVRVVEIDISSAGAHEYCSNKDEGYVKRCWFTTAYLRGYIAFTHQTNEAIAWNLKTHLYHVAEQAGSACQTQWVQGLGNDMADEIATHCSTTVTLFANWSPCKMDSK